MLSVWSGAICVQHRMTRAEFDGLLDRIDFDSLIRKQDLRCRRKHRRHDYRARNVALEVAGADGDAMLIATTRNISAGGISFLFDQRLAFGTKCWIRLVDVHGEGHTLSGYVVHARAFDKRLFEVGICFDEQIDPSEFIAST